MNKFKKFMKALFAHPFRLRFEGKVIENDVVVVEDLNVGIFWIIVLILILL